MADAGSGITVAEFDLSAIRQVRLAERFRILRLVLGILAVCDVALRLQGAEQDEQIAEVLRYCGGQRLQEAIEEMHRMLREWAAEVPGDRRERRETRGSASRQSVRGKPSHKALTPGQPGEQQVYGSREGDECKIALVEPG
jgi:hypothetical protein